MGAEWAPPHNLAHTSDTTWDKWAGSHTHADASLFESVGGGPKVDERGHLEPPDSGPGHSPLTPQGREEGLRGTGAPAQAAIGKHC